MYTELGRKIREAIRLESVPPGGDSEEKRLHRQRPSLERKQSEPLTGFPSLGVTQGRRAPLACWQLSGTNRRAVGRQDPACEEHTTLACSQSGQERADWDHTVSWHVSQDHSRALPGLSRVRALALLPSRHSSTRREGCPNQGKGLAVRLWQLSAKRLPSREGPSSLVIAQVLHESQARALTVAVSPHSMPSLCWMPTPALAPALFTSGAEGAGAGKGNTHTPKGT